MEALGNVGGDRVEVAGVASLSVEEAHGRWRSGFEEALGLSK
jgi:hypothetical protein